MWRVPRPALPCLLLVALVAGGLLAAPAADAHRVRLGGAGERYVKRLAGADAKRLAHHGTTVRVMRRRTSCHAVGATRRHHHRARCTFGWTRSLRRPGATAIPYSCRGSVTLRARSRTSRRVVASRRRLRCRRPSVTPVTPPPSTGPLPLPAPIPSGPDATVLAAGDITGCNDEAEATARLLDAQPAASVLALGDNAYPQGTAQQYAKCYDPTWGRAKARTLPTPGNHEYDTPGATGYFGYFGAAAGPGYYSADRGTWHLVSLNSEIDASATSAQYRWLEADLAAHPATCTLAFWHRPRFSGGSHGDSGTVAALFALLHERGVDVLLTGHDHTYQRWAPMSPSGTVDAARGVREFVVGTGGRSHYPNVAARPGLEVADDTTSGVLELVLHAGRYDWRFVPIAGRSFTDAGGQACH
jgi:hypothetical protein